MVQTVIRNRSRRWIGSRKRARKVMRLRPDEITAFERMLEECREPTPNVSPGRPPTREELIVAAWANLAIERPYLTLEEMRRFLDEEP